MKPLPRAPRRRLRLVTGLAGLSLEVAVWTVAAVQTLPPPVLFAAHLLASILVGLAFPGWRRPPPPPAAAPSLEREGDAPVREAKVRARPQHDHALGYVVVGFAFLFPVLGAAGALLAAFARQRGAGSFDEVVAAYRELVEASHPIEEIASDARERVTEDTWSALELRPFVDIVATEGHEDDLAVSAIESTALLEQHTACRLLRFALSSAVPATRYYAARALARVEERLDAELERTLEIHRARPDDVGATLALARARMAYGDLAAGDDPLVTLHMEEARKLLESVHGRLTGDAIDEGLAGLARVSLRLGQVDRARELFDELVRRGTRRAEVYRGLAICLHAQRDYLGLRRTLGTARERCPDSAVVAEMCRTWGVGA